MLHSPAEFGPTRRKIFSTEFARDLTSPLSRYRNPTLTRRRFQHFVRWMSKKFPMGGVFRDYCARRLGQVIALL
jgi:hypothetical protein